MASKLRNVFSKRSDEDLNKKSDYTLSEVARYGFPFMPMCICYDPIQSLLAIGTKTGSIRILGRPGVDVVIQHGDDVAVVALQFVINIGRLISATSDDHIHLWDLKWKQPEIIHSLKFQRDRITCLYQPLQSTWLFVGTDKGNVYLVNVEKFELSGYSIMWNKTMDFNQKHHPGYVTQIIENPINQSKILIAYETGMIVMWDLNKKSVDSHFRTPNVNHVSWHHEGKLFMSCHGDGSLSIWNVKSPQSPEKSWLPHLKEGNDGNAEKCQPITKVEWKSSKSSDSIIIFNGGLSADKGSTPSITLTYGEEVVTFKLDSPVIDFEVICSAPHTGVIPDPVAVVVLMREEFIVVDLQHKNLLPFEPAYPFDIHESKVTCCQYLTNCSPDITSMLYSITSKHKKKNFSEKEWPIKGGQWGSPVFSYSEIIITGHEDGSVRFWDATGVTLLMLYKIKSARLFNSESSEIPKAGDCSETSPTLQTKADKNHHHHHWHAVRHLAFCDESKLLCVAGYSHAILFKFVKSETTSDCPAIDIHMVFQNFDVQPNNSDKRVGPELSSPEDEKQVNTMERILQMKSDVSNWPPGYRPEFCCFLVWNHGKLPLQITSISLNSKYGLLAIGSETGLAIVDILSKTCLFAFACPDLYGTNDPFSRCPPTLSINPTADQPDEKKTLTPVSSTSTDDPNKLIMPNKINEGEDSSSQSGTLVVPAPKPPPRRKRQAALEKVERLPEKCGAQEGEDEPNVLGTTDDASPVPQSDPLSPASNASTDSWLIVDIDSKDCIVACKDAACVAKEGISSDKVNENQEMADKVEFKPVSGQGNPTLKPNCLCSQFNPKKSAIPENNFSKICCCIKEAERPLSTEEMELLSLLQNDSAPKITMPSPVSNTIPFVTSETESSLMQSSANLKPKEDALPIQSTDAPLPASISVSPAVTSDITLDMPLRSLKSPALASATSNPSTSSWKLKFNRFRNNLLNSVSALMTNSSSGNRAKVKFQVIDLSDDVVIISKEKSYLEYARRCQGQSVGEASITSDDDTIKESILYTFFMDSFPYKNEATSVPCLWVGTSLGSVLVFSLETPSMEASNHCPVVAPTGTIFRLKGSMVSLSFLDSNLSSVLQAPNVSWKEFDKESRTCLQRKTLEDATSDTLQDVLLTSDRQISLISLPSMNCIQKFKIADCNYITQAKVVCLKDSICLLTHHQKGNIMLFDVASIRPVQDFNHAVGTLPRLPRSFNFSNLGHGMVMKFPTEIQKFVITKGPEDELSELKWQLYTPCEMPGIPKIGFFQSLFENQSQTKLDRDALFGESGSGKANKMVGSRCASKLEKAQVAEGGTSEIAQARLAAIERGEKLGELEEKSGMLKMNAEAFAQMSSQLKNKYKPKKWYQF